MQQSFTKILMGVLLIGIWMVLPGYGQIAIDISEYPHSFGTVFHFYDVADTNGISVNVGSPGGPQTWTFDINMYPNGVNQDFEVVDPATTPFSNDFPTSDHAWFNADTALSENSYIFFDLTNTELHLLGVASSSALGDTATVFDTPSTVAQFPIQFGNSFPDTFTLSFSIDSLGFTLQVDVTTITQTTIDAWGTIVVPLGTFDCLRGQQLSTQITVVSLFGVPIITDTTTSITYSWLGENHGILAQVTSMDNEIDPNFTQAADVMFQTSGPTGISDNDIPVAGDFELIGNYPNPFNPTTTISFNLPQNEVVTLDVFNITGQKVATLVNGRMAAGRHDVLFDASDLPSGIYFYRLSAGSFQDMKRMVLIK